MVSGLTLIFRPLIHFEFIFVYSVREYSNFILLHVVVQFSQHHLLKKLSSPLYTLASFAVDEFDNISSGLFLDSLFCSMASPGDPPRPAGKSVPGSYEIVVLPLFLVCMRFCVRPIRVKPLFSPIPCSSCNQALLGLSQMLWDLLFPVSDPHTGGPDVGLRTLTPVGKPL